MNHGGGPGVILAATSRYSAGHTITLNGRITASDYVDILDSRVHPVFQMLFINNDSIFQDYSSSIHTTRLSLGLRSMKIHFDIFLGQLSRHP
jgi:hypothetical protein